jgi:hypothetical protein
MVMVVSVNNASVVPADRLNNLSLETTPSAWEAQYEG